MQNSSVAMYIALGESDIVLNRRWYGSANSSAAEKSVFRNGVFISGGLDWRIDSQIELLSQVLSCPILTP